MISPTPLYKGIAVIICLVTFTACGGERTDKQEETDSGRQLEFTQEVTFLGNDNSEISTIVVAVADDQASRNQGLMDVNNLPNDAGMLFIFPEEEELSFYMANTPLPLDIIFVNSDSTIVRIHHNTAPFSNRQLESDEPAQFVVETNGGYCISHDVQEGMKVKF
ncbi:MAG: DUF192 domain-containing protein [Balneolaceae bacterium]